MEEKVLQFDNGIQRYRSIAEKHAENNDFVGALGFLFSALKLERNPSVITDIADIYADMALYELSNQYWFYYLDIVSEDKKGVAYEELAINFFYMGNILASGYYFHLKIEADGYIRQEGLDPEILNFFSEEEHKRKLYRIAYPFDRADYSFIMERAKKAVVAGDYDKAVLLYSSIPEGASEYYDAVAELSVAKFLADDVDDAIVSGKKLVKEQGESVSVCCNLSSMYAFKGDKEKSRYYYSRALSLQPKSLEDRYKLATCSLENEEHLTGIKYLDEVLKERNNDVVMRLFSGIARINVGDYDGAERELSIVLKIDPFNINYKYYFDLAIKLKNGGSAGRLLPLKYLAIVPQSVENSRVKKIKALYEQDYKKIRSELKKGQVVELLKWGLAETDPPICKLCVLILAKAECKTADKILSDALMNSQIEPDVKRIIIYVLIVNGNKERHGVVARSFYFYFKPKKLPCEKDENGVLYFHAYATCMSRMIFVDGDCLDKLAFSTDKVYKALGDIYDNTLATKDEMAALIVSITKTERKLTDKDICAIFNVDKEKLKILKESYDASKN